MTFDFAPEWLDSTAAATETSVFAATAAATPLASVRVIASPKAPVHPTESQMASLVGELFAEGSLSFEQLCSLSNAPELEHLLGDTVAGVAPSRRALGRR